MARDRVDLSSSSGTFQSLYCDKEGSFHLGRHNLFILQADLVILAGPQSVLSLWMHIPATVHNHLASAHEKVQIIPGPSSLFV